MEDKNDTHNKKPSIQMNIINTKINNNTTQSEQSTFKKSIWKQLPENQGGDWRLFYDYNSNLDVSDKSNISSQINQNNDQQIKLFDPNLKKVFGSLVMTHKGIGKLIKQEDCSIKIDNISNKIPASNQLYTVKILKTNTDNIFESSEIFNSFPILIRIINREQSKWIKISIPANGNVEILKKILEEYKVIQDLSKSWYLVFNGQELKDGIYFDQLEELRPNSKLLLCCSKMTQCKINRFGNINSWWYTYPNDGITFSVNKHIKLTGMGLYGSHEDKVQIGTLVIFEGIVNNGNNLVDENVEIPPASSQEECITQIKFKKPVNISAKIDYTIQFTCTNYCYFYYGSNGKNVVEGDKKIEFNFKCTSANNQGSSVESGNFPEFYYYC